MSSQGGPRRHFRPSPIWPQAAIAHEQLSMASPSSKEGERCRGKLATKAAWVGECVGGSWNRETRWSGEAGRLGFGFLSSGQATPGHPAFVLGEGAAPGSLSPALLCGPSSLPAPGCTRPTLPRCPASGCSCQPQAWGAPRRPFLSPLQSSWGAGRAGLGRRGHRAGFGARAWWVPRSPSACYWLVGLQGDASISGKVPAREVFRNLILFFFFFAFASVLGEGVCWALLLSVQTTTSYADFRVTYS